MCGIVGVIAQRDVAQLLVDGLKRLEYRGYDSAGVAVLDNDGQLTRQRSLGKVAELDAALQANPLPGKVGIAHTRWATHGKPSEANAHPHVSSDEVAIVHNGIIENFVELSARVKELGYSLSSETDTEVIAHLFHHHYLAKRDLLQAALTTSAELTGAFALAIIHKDQPNRILAIRRGSPLVIGFGSGENYLGSDTMALLPLTQRFTYLQEGDIADIQLDKVDFYDEQGEAVEREIKELSISHTQVDKGEYRHYMQKEIFEQPLAVSATLEGRLSAKHVLEESFGARAAEIFPTIKRVQIVACGTSFHAGSVARFWFETLAEIPCNVEIASEFRYHKHIVEPGTLFVTLSQSGETADTLAALELAKELGFAASLCICNAPESSLVRESDMRLMTHAGPEVGVASTKAFTTQLTALLMLVAVLGRYKGLQDDNAQQTLVDELRAIPRLTEETLKLDDVIKELSNEFVDKQHALFLGRGIQYPIAKEGALKLKEISYIHAEAYPAGELKHGPLALVDKEMPVIAVAPNDKLLEKLKSNLQEVRARGGQLYVFADPDTGLSDEDGVKIIHLPKVPTNLAPLIYTLPLQQLSYHVAVMRGTDVDQPRNLAKSVTVE